MVDTIVLSIGLLMGVGAITYLIHTSDRKVISKKHKPDTNWCKWM